MKYLILTLSAFLLVFNGTVWAKSTRDKIKDKIEDFSESLQGKVDEIGDNLVALQDYLDHYQWKGLIHDEAPSGAVTLKHLQLNGHSRAIVAKPGQKIGATVLCQLDREKCEALKVYRVVIGLKGEGAQTTIANDLGVVAGESIENFQLKAPDKPGFYEVRFRLVQSLLESKALESWKDAHGKEPDGTTTIGVILVK